MHINTDITFERQSDGGTYERPRSHILVARERSGYSVDGAVLEAAVSVGDRSLLFVTDDIPYEEALYVTLYDKDWAVLDAATLGAAYSTGSFRNLVLEPPTRLRFRFIGGADWTLDLLDQPALRLPYLGDSKGVTHRFGFRRYFFLRGKPQPEIRS